MGGRPTFEALVSHFYALVAIDPILRPMYPDSDLKGAAERLLLFLEQYWGGPKTYSEQRGHPRLRMRHAPYAIGAAERDAWLECMDKALLAVPALAPVDAALRAYFLHTAHFLQNRPD